MQVLEFLKLLEADMMRLSQPEVARSKMRLCSRIIHPRFAPVLLIRLSQFFHETLIFRPLSYVFSVANVILFGLEVTPRCKIGPGLLIPHTSGTVIGAVEIGSNVTIFQGVTLGAKLVDLRFDPASRPMLDDNVVIGSGAKVLGNIRIGRNAVVAANSLVTESVPDGALAIGVPAVVKIRE